ncbi:MAG: NAD(P)-dependent dehydrogenase (short-subunit alcohol dehydrogenase family) [Enterobacterales bacterium]|jgi:NAD(P)-dependent dehydrogenase (short-subunit alcohol dehydrogenase family)
MKQYFNNKVIIITGAAGGIGSELVKQLLQCKAKIAALDLQVDSLNSHDNMLSLAVDITDKNQLASALTRVHQYFGKVDILINNAGITHLCKFTDLEDELLEKVMAINFLAAAEITRLCLPFLQSSQGQIVAISSVAGFAPLYGRTAYSASKHAMHGFFSSLACEVADDGISITIVCPSFVKSRPELKAEPSSGALSPGALKKNTNGQEMSPEVAVNRILTAVKKRKAFLYLGKVSIIAKWLSILLPKTYLNIMTKAAKNELNLD